MGKEKDHDFTNKIDNRIWLRVATQYFKKSLSAAAHPSEFI